MKKILVAVIMVMGVLTVTNAFAAIVGPWVNGHYYEAVPGEISWTDASIAAQAKSYNGVNGYLATLTSEAENMWVWNHVLSGSTKPKRYLLGGYQYGDPVPIRPPDSDSLLNWAWVTGEPWVYTKWNTPTGEPNDYSGNPEHVLAYYDSNGKWNDTTDSKSYYSGDFNKGYIVEYPVPEPASMALLGIGLLGAIGAGFRRKK